MYVDIVISNAFNLNKHFFFSFLFSLGFALPTTFNNNNNNNKIIMINDEIQMKFMFNDNLILDTIQAYVN